MVPAQDVSARVAPVGLTHVTVRVWDPPPHVAEHAPKAPSAHCPAGAHADVLHACVWMVPWATAHDAPPFDACTEIENCLDCVPPPQETEHAE